jgi:hypothetical protein
MDKEKDLLRYHADWHSSDEERLVGSSLRTFDILFPTSDQVEPANAGNLQRQWQLDPHPRACMKSKAHVPLPLVRFGILMAVVAGDYVRRLAMDRCCFRFRSARASPHWSLILIGDTFSSVVPVVRLTNQLVGHRVIDKMKTMSLTKRSLDLQISPSHKKAKSNQSFKLRQLNNSFRRTNDEIHSTIDLDPVTCALLSTPPMQRLRGLKQLGTAEYVFVNTNHNRLEHSLGVAALAAHAVRAIKNKQGNLPCTEKDILCVSLAGLMHDIGHGPFSHVYEDFVENFQPIYLERNPHLKAFYQGLPEPPTDWSHEMMSLQMIDIALRHLGLEIDMDNLDAPLKQIGDGVDATSMRVFSDQVVDDILTSRDFCFIKECIWGKPVPDIYKQVGSGDPAFVGRESLHQEWLYSFVNDRYR